MADWWEQDTQAGGTATASNWWENDPTPGMRTETLPSGASFPMAEGTSFDELMQKAVAGQPAARQANIDRIVGTLPEDATRLEELNFKRRQELITGEPATPTGDKRLDDITRQRLAKEIADMNAKGLGPDEMLLEERYQAEQDPLTNLINAPIMRGAMTGVQNAASSIAETALRILPGEGAPSQLADKIGRQRAAEGQYQTYLDEKQGAPAALPNQVTQMVGEYLPLSASGVPAALQVGVKGANDAYLKSDDHTYALTSGIVQGALTYAGGKLAGGTWIDMIGGKVAGKKLAPLLKGFGIESGEELGQLYGQALIDRGFDVGDGSMPTAKDAVWTLATVLGARGFGSAMSAGIEDDGVNKPSVERQAYDAMRKFAERKWPSRKLAEDAGVDRVATTAKERAKLATDIRNRLTGQQFEEQLRAAAVSPEQADLDMEVWRARAVAAGESFDEFVGKRVKGIEKTTSDNSVYMAQRQSGKPDALAQAARSDTHHLANDNFKRWAGTDNVVLHANADMDLEVVYDGALDTYQILDHTHNEQVGDSYKTEEEAYKAADQLTRGDKFETGKPVVAKVYHGSPAADFQRFDREKLGANTGARSAKKGFFFAGNPETAGMYTGFGWGADAPETGITVNHEGWKFVEDNLLRGEVIGDIEWKHGADIRQDKPKESVPGLYKAIKETDRLGRLAESQTDKAERSRMLRDAEDIRENFLEKILQTLPNKNQADAWKDAYKVWYDAAYQNPDTSPEKLSKWVNEHPKETKEIVERAAKRAGYESFEYSTRPAHDFGGGGTMPVYVRMKNPLVFDYAGGDYTDKPFSKSIQEGIDGGHDGVILMRTYDGGPIDNVFITFDEKNIKSALGNQGTFKEKPSILAQKTAPKPRGEIQFHKDDGRATIRLFEGANESTFIHESAHLFRRDLQGEELKKAERWAGARNGKWNRRAEEKFARGFERYLREGIAPNKSLETIFARFKAALTKVYGAIKGTAIDVNISPEMRTVFDRLLTPAETNTQTQGATNGQVQTEGLAEGQVARIPHPLDDNSPLELGTFPPPESDILSQDLADRFRGLANRAVDQRARDANFAVDEAMGIPGTRERQVAVNEAEGRLKADPVGEARKFLAAIDEADRNNGAIPLTEADLRVYTALIEEAGKDISTPENRALHAKMQRGFRQGMTEAARLLGTRDPMGVMDPEARKRKSIVDAVTYTPSSDPADAAAMEERYNTAKEALAKQGIDLDDIDSIVADPKKAMVVLDHMRPGSKVSDVLYEYWRNSILSGPTTQATNIIGNTVFGAWNLGVERTVEAAINIFGRNKKAATFGEFRHLIGGVLPGIVRGIRNARTSWSLETSALAEELGRDGAFKVDGPRGSIKGRMGRLVRALGYRPLLAADEFAKSVVVTMEVGARAYRHGQELGLKGDELQTFIQQQTDDLGSVSWSEAFAKAEELTFQGNRGMVAQNLAKGGNRLRSIPGARWVLPFVDTPSAIFEQGIKRMPVLGAILDYAESRRSGMNLVDAGLTPTLARQIIAFGGMALLWEAVSGDDPWLTGADPLSDPKNRDAAFRAQPPMSIKIGDQWYSYARIEPFATAIATTADSVKGIQGGKYYKPLTGLFQQAKEKSYLDGLGDAIDALQGLPKGDTGPAEQYGSKFIASWIPNLYRQTVRSAEGEMPENRMWGKLDDRFKRFLNRTGQQAGLPFVESQPRFDLWGQPISYNDMGDSPATSFAFRLMSPVKAKDLSTVQQADMALIRWNEKHPDDQEVYSEPQKYIKIQDQTQYLTDEQHAQYAELSGQLAQQYVSGIAFDPVNPTAQQIARIKKAIANARERARKQLIPTWTFD